MKAHVSHCSNLISSGGGKCIETYSTYNILNNIQMVGETLGTSQYRYFNIIERLYCISYQDNNICCYTLYIQDDLFTWIQSSPKLNSTKVL